MTLSGTSDPTASIQWEAHACLPLIPGQSVAPLLTVLRVIAGFRQWLTEHADGFVLASTSQCLQRTREAGKLAVPFDLEGSSMLLEDPAMVEVFAHLGVRRRLLAYNRDNPCAGGCQVGRRALVAACALWAGERPYPRAARSLG